MPKLGLTLRQLADMGIAPPQPYAGVNLPPQLPAPAPQQDKGIFGIRPGSKGAIIAGIIGDTLASVSGGQPLFTMNMMQERQRKQQAEAEEAQWRRRRTAGREDRQWEWENKPREPRAPYRFQDNAGNLVEIGPDGRPRTVFTDPTPKINYQRVNNPDGTFTMVPIPMGGVPAAAPPTRPVGNLTPIDGGPGGSPPGAGFPYR